MYTNTSPYVAALIYQSSTFSLKSYISLISVQRFINTTSSCTFISSDTSIKFLLKWSADNTLSFLTSRASASLGQYFNTVSISLS